MFKRLLTVVALAAIVLAPADLMANVPNPGEFINQLVLLPQTQQQAEVRAQEDQYLPYLYAEESVFGCTDDDAFELLLKHEPVSTLDGLCVPHEVADNPVFIGWHFADPPVWADDTDKFVVARKYIMETQDGPMKFLWPAPLDPSDVSFESFDLQEAEVGEQPMMDYYEPAVLNHWEFS